MFKTILDETNRMRFCETCSNLLTLSSNDDGTVDQVCQKCGRREPLNPKNEKEAMILETNLRSGSSAGGASSGITVNNYTLKDPTLPHINSISCPNDSCPSRANESIRDVIYIKTDPTNLKFQYVCTVCVTQWTN
jgi:DNA-directed RNA polymerase subunit M/transcription elongation factor TFIIS